MASKAGWIIAVVLTAAVGTIVAVKLARPSPSAPTAEARRAGFLDLMEVKLPLEPILGFHPQAPGNAGDDYKLAVDLYTANKGLLADAMEKKKELAKGAAVLGPDALNVIRRIHRHVADGARKRRMRYTLVHTAPKFKVGYWYEPAAGNLQGVSEALELLMLHHLGRKEYPGAAEALKNEFVLGWHMMRERARVDLVIRGLSIQQRAIAGLLTIYSSPGESRHAARIKALRNYLDRLRDLSEDYQHKQGIVWRVNPNPGDLFIVVEGDKDRAFRVQALLALGVVRYTHRGRPADVRRAEELLAKYARSEDPILAAAAKAGAELTRTEFNLLGTR